MKNRYITSDDAHPRQGYAYVSGQLSTYNGKPQFVLTSKDQITDTPRHPPKQHSAEVRITAILPDPQGPDKGIESITLKNVGTADADLTGWTLEDSANHTQILTGTLRRGEETTIISQVSLNNKGDTLYIKTSQGEIQDTVTYKRCDVLTGQPVVFS